MLHIFRAVLRHTGLQIGSDRSPANQDFPHPLWFQFGTDPRQRRRYAALWAEVLIRCVKVLISFGCYATEITALVARHALEGRQRNGNLFLIG